MSTQSFSITRRVMLTGSLLGIGAGISLGIAACTPQSVKPVPDPTPDPAPDPDPESSATSTAQQAPELLLATLARGTEIAVIDPARAGADAVVRTIKVGSAPWGIAVHAESSTAYVATAQGLAIVDLTTSTRTALVQYQHPAPAQSTGEYRPGGLGAAVAPDGSRVYVAVTTGDGSDVLEVFDTASGTFVGFAPVGLRPFDVLVAPDGAWAATVDHDSFTVTVVDAATLKATPHTVAPFGTDGGLASWEKPHYGAVDARGGILLPYQGLMVARLDPATGQVTTLKSGANSHSHGTALAGRRLLTVGTGAFGNASGDPNLSILDLDGGGEQIVPLTPPHETVTVWTDTAGAEYAAIGGGNTRGEGWDGITLVSLADLSKRAISVPGYPQVVVSFAAR